MDKTKADINMWKAYNNLKLNVIVNAIGYAQNDLCYHIYLN